MGRATGGQCKCGKKGPRKEKKTTDDGKKREKRSRFKTEMFLRSGPGRRSKNRRKGANPDTQREIMAWRGGSRFWGRKGKVGGAREEQYNKRGFASNRIEYAVNIGGSFPGSKGRGREGGGGKMNSEQERETR